MGQLSPPLGPVTEPSILRRICDVLQEGPSNDPDSQLSPGRLTSAFNAVYLQMTGEAYDRPQSDLTSYANATIEDASTGRLTLSCDPDRIGAMITITRRQNENDTMPNGQEWRTVLRDATQTFLGSYCGSGVMKREGGRLYCDTPNWGFWRLWFLRVPAPLSWGYCENASPSKTSLTLAETPEQGETYSFYDDQYQFDYLTVTPAGGQRQKARIASSAASTRVLTLEAVNGGTGDAVRSDITSGDTYSIIPWYPAEHVELACMMVAQKLSKRPASKAFNQMIVDRYARWKEFVSRDDQTTPRIVRNDGMFGVGMNDGNTLGVPVAYSGQVYPGGGW